LIQSKDGPLIILDVAHNPPAMEYLVQKLHSTYPDAKFRVVIGMSSDKDLSLNAKLVLQVVNNDPTAIHLVEAAHPRAAKLEHIFDAQPLLTSSHYNRDDRSVELQVHAAMELAKQNGEILVVCGSVFLMAAAREALGFDEPRDSQYIAAVAGAGFRHGQENFANTNPEDPIAQSQR
jgi:dihydrofolate synthase/folylpolyglutamate synthase